MPFIPHHLNTLQNIVHIPQIEVGYNALQWGQQVLENLQLNANLNRRFSRPTLLNYCQNPENDDLHVTVAVLAWGGMRRDHATTLFNTDGWQIVVQGIRNGAIETKETAFQEFQQLRNVARNGLGIGYFTKLICFLNPELNGYILDQWTGKSVNLLTGQPHVNISPAGWVNDNNTAQVYQTFCSYIDELSQELGLNGLDTEERIFSTGRGQGAWRNYLIANYHNG